MTAPNLDHATERRPAPVVAFTLRPIGIVHAAPAKRGRIPKYFVIKGRATLELFQPFHAGLQGLYDGAELWITTYHAPSGQDAADSHRTAPGHRGVFSTSTVERPNPIEFLRARVVDLDFERGLLQVEGLEAEDGAPILDIRPATAPHHGLTRPDAR